MTLDLEMPQVADLRPRITVFGVGGAGCNAVNNMIAKDLEGVDFVVANTDAQVLKLSKSPVKIQLGEKVTEGLGAGAMPQVGAAAAEESIETIIDHLAGAHMCFITAGMGGGTGTGAAPIIAQAARELGILTVGVVTKPFQFEGGERAKQAEMGVEALEEMVDTLIMIPNQNLFRLANEKTTFTEAFSMADDVLYNGVKGVTDLMVRPGIINLDFADIRVVMNEMGKAMMGTGEAEGEDRAIQAAEKAINNPLLDEISLDGAKGVLINITGGQDLTLFEVDEAANKIRDRVDATAKIWVGSAFDDNLDGKIRVSVVATGIDAKEGVGEVPVPRRTLKSPLPLRVEDIKEDVCDAEPEQVTQTEELPTAEIATIFAPTREQPEATTGEEPSLFDVPNFEPTAETQMDDMQMDEGLLGQEFSDQTADEFTTDVAPSNDTLQRLQAAVDKKPESYDPNTHHQRNANVTPLPEVPRDAGRKGMLGSLIDRMTGHSDEEATPQHYRQEPSLGETQGDFTEDYREMSDDDEQVDVPAFLRRQAN